MGKAKKRAKRPKKSVPSSKKKEIHDLFDKNISPDISPLKGFDENASVSQDKDLVFDRLVNPDLKLEFIHKPIKTYVKERIYPDENPVLEFESCKNRDSIIKWLNDTRNAFGKLTQESQENQDFDKNTPSFNLDVPSVSQHYNKRQKNRERIPYRLRPRSLEVNYKNKKNLSLGKMKRYKSLTAVSPIEDNYSIEAPSTVNEEPFLLADKEAKLVMDLLEDECLDNIDQVLHQEKKSDWNRMKDLNKTLNPSKPKQLNITVYNKEHNDPAPRRSYDLNLIESYFQANMGKELNITVNQENHPLNELGYYFLNSLKKLTKDNLLQFQPLIKQINAFCLEEYSTVSTQTTSCSHFDDKMTQTSINSRCIDTQTDGNICAMVLQETMDKQVQTDASTQSKTNNFKPLTATTPSDLLLDSEMDRLFAVMENNSNVKEEDSKILSETNVATSTIAKTTALNDSLDLCMDTEEFIKAQIKLKPVKGIKRLRSESPTKAVKKRPCQKFIEDDLSIAFLSEQDRDIDQKSNSSSLDGDIFLSNDKVEDISKMNTQEEVEKYDDLIYNANRIVNITLSSNDSTNIGEDRNSDDREANTPKRSNIKATNFTNGRRSLFSESLFDDKETTVLENKTMVNEDGSDNRPSATTPKINILENIVLQPATTDFVDHVSVEDSCDSFSSDKDIVDATPTPDISCSKKENKLNITLPPPVEFQDSEKSNKHTKTSPRRPLAEINKITSTPVALKPNSEPLSLSPIEQRRNLGHIEILHQTKFFPLTVDTSSQRSSIKTTPKQKSILSYVRNSQESNKSSEGLPLRKKPCVTCSRLNRDEVVRISSMAKKDLITFSNYYSDKVTHLIVSVNKSTNRLLDYTIKFVRAVAAGIWILNFQWIEECLAANRLVPEGPYEVFDLSGATGPKSSRLTRHLNPLLKDFKIYVTNYFMTTSKQEVEDIIKTVGGEVFASLDDLRQKSLKHCLIITESRARKNCQIYDEWLCKYKVVTLDLEWLSCSLGQYKLQNLRPYTLCSEDTLDQLGYPKELTLSMSYSSSDYTSRSGLSLTK